MNELNNEQFKQDSLKDSQQSSYENDIDGLEVKNEDVHVKLNNSGVRKSFNKEFIERIMNYVTSRLTTKITNVEKMINRNVKNLKHCKQEVSKLEKITESAKQRELKITLVSDDIKFFFQLARNKQLDLIEGDAFYKMNDPNFMSQFGNTNKQSKGDLSKSQQRLYGAEATNRKSSHNPNRRSTSSMVNTTKKNPYNNDKIDKVDVDNIVGAYKNDRSSKKKTFENVYRNDESNLNFLKEEMRASEKKQTGRKDNRSSPDFKLSSSRKLKGKDYFEKAQQIIDKSPKNTKNDNYNSTEHVIEPIWKAGGTSNKRSKSRSKSKDISNKSTASTG